MNKMPKQHLGAHIGPAPTNRELGITMIGPPAPSVRELITKALKTKPAAAKKE